MRDIIRNMEIVTNGRSARASSWDRTGDNKDWISIHPGQTATVDRHRNLLVKVG